MWLGIPLVIALVIAGISIFLLIKSSKWQSVSANITSSNITSIYHSPNSAITNHKNTHDYKIDIQYQYTIEGTIYTGNTLYAGLPNIINTYLEAKKIQETFPVGAKTKAYYNPNNPQQSALLIFTSNTKGNTFVLFLIGLVVVVFIGAGIYIIPKI